VFLLAAVQAHATLVCGHEGGGRQCSNSALGRAWTSHVGTLSKAVGAIGGLHCLLVRVGLRP